MTRSAMTLVALAMTAGAVTPALAQTVVQGPVYNSTNGSRYYVVQASGWSQARTFALAMGADLATVEDGSENAWIAANLTNAGTRKLFIGYNDAQTEGSFRWASGSNATYTNWHNGAPDNSGDDDYALLSGDGGWDCRPGSYSPFAVIETGGQLRVPQEFPTIAAAVNAFDSAGTRVIRLEPGGTYPVDATISTTGNQARIFGNGSTVLTPTSGPMLTASSPWIMNDLTIQGRGNAPLLTITGGEVNAFNVHFRPAPASTQPSVLLGHATFRHDRGSYQGGSAALTVQTGVPTAYLRSVVIRGCTSVTKGSSGRVNIANATITGCGPANLFDAGITHAIRSCIVWGNSGAPSPITGFAQLSNFYPAVAGFGNISADPRFVDSANGDYRLQPGSPSIDSGSILGLVEWIPSLAQATFFVDADGNPRLADDPSMPDSSEGKPAVDQGAYEFQGSSCAADFNRDGTVDFFDYLDFVQAFDNGCN